MQFTEETSDNFEKKIILESYLEDNKNFFGPALPPHLLRKNLLDGRKSETIHGPTLPDQFSDKGEDLEGTTLPVSKPEGKILIGPEIPEEFLKPSHSFLKAEEKTNVNYNEEDDFGPSKNLMVAVDDTTFKFKNSQSSYKLTLQNANESSVKRETWMTELPKKKSANFGLFPRHFKSRVQTDKEMDDSVWTETPADKKKKDYYKKIKSHKEILQMKRLKERDKEMEKLVKKAAKKLKKKQSLLEMHVESLKKKKIESKKKEKEGKTLPKRRPFDRDVDLQIRKIDENQKTAILSKSQFLNDRFAPGQSKFL